MDQPLRLMAVHAHPDDESSKGAAVMACYVAQGVEVLVVTCTGGERGSILNPRLMHDPSVRANLPQIRRQEMDAAREILGVRQAWLGFVDSGLPEGDPLPPLPEGCFGLVDPQSACEPLVKLIREFRPQVMTTYDENGGYPHPDHIMTHHLSMAAYQAASDPQRFPNAGQPWQVAKVYYNQTFSRARLRVLHEALLRQGLHSPYGEWFSGHVDEPDRAITTRVPCAEFFSVRDRALLSHATQIDPDGPFFACPLDLERQVWPTEDYELARSNIPVSLPEDDLFAGLRQGQTAPPQGSDTATLPVIDAEPAADFDPVEQRPKRQRGKKKVPAGTS